MIKVGLVGLGYWGPNHARVLNQTQKCDFVACCDIDPEKLAKVRSQYPFLRGFSRVSEMLDSNIDAVVIATPILTHYEIALGALSRGKHVLVEKPLAHHSAQAEELVAVARRKGITLMTGHTFIYSPSVVKVKELIDSGELGEIYYISMSRVNLGLFQKDVDVIWDLAVHDISILLYWLGEMPSQSKAFGRACVQKNKNDVAFIWLQFPSGTIASTEISWLSPQKMRRTSIVGSKRMIVYDDTEPSEKVKIYDRGVILRAPQTFGEFQLTYREGDMIAPHLSNEEPLLAEVEHFLDCVETGATPRTDGNLGVNVVRVLEMAVNSLTAEEDSSMREPALQTWERVP